MQESAAEAYNQLDAALTLAGMSVLPAEVHGVLVGSLCSHLRTGIKPDLMSLIVDDHGEATGAIAEVSELAYTLYRAAMEMLLQDEAGFDLLLPDDSEPLQLRTESLGAWCQGFMLGLLQDDSVGIDEFGGDSVEIIEDIMAISGAITGEQNPDKDEWAFAEIEEYLRVGVQLVFETIYEQRAASAPAIQQ